MRTALGTSFALVAAMVTFAQATKAEQANFSRQWVEDNDLWMEDSLDATRGTTQEQFNQVIDLGLEFYKPVAAENQETLRINRRWDDATVNANCSRMWGGVSINMYGGLARRDEVTAEGFALVLCHELGHAYGGTPYLSEYNKMSAEGQSDWWGAGECLKKVLSKLPENDKSYSGLTPFVEAKCAEKAAVDTPEYKICLRGMSASMSLGTLLSVLKKEPTPSAETPDTTVVETLNLSYPATIQCRYDNYFLGTLGMDRPLCWFKP